MKKTGILLFLLLFPLWVASQDFRWNLKAGAYNRVEDEKSYLVAGFKPYFYYDKFYGALDMEFSFRPDGSLKQNDWDNARNIATKLFTLGYGEKEKDPVFFQFGILNNVTIGYGMLVRHFRNDIYYPQIRKIGFFGGYDFGYNGITIFTEDTFDPDLFGGRVFFRPLYPLELQNIPAFFKFFQFGISFVMDSDTLDQETSANGFYLTKDNANSRTVRVYGLDMGIPITDNDYFSLENYVQYGDIQRIGASLGYGVKGKVIEVLGYEVQVCYIWGGFIPGYFSAFYDVREIRDSRYEVALNAPDGWEYLGHIWADLFEKQWVIGAEVEKSPAEGESILFYSYLKPSLLKRLFLKFSYQRRDIKGLVDAFDVQSLNKAMIFLEIGYDLAANANISLRYIRNYRENNGMVSGGTLTEIQTNLLF